MDFSENGMPSPEWEAFAKTNPAAGQPAKVPHSLTPEQIQAQTNAAREEVSAALCAAHGLDETVRFEDHSFPTRDASTVTVRAYRPKDGGTKPLPALIYFHGGGYLFGSLGSERFLCSSLAAKVGILVLHVCYRHTPAFTHPVAHHDGYDGMQWIARHADVLGMDPANVVVGGLSAGAAVAGNAVLDAVDNGAAQQAGLRIRALVLGIPWILHKDAFPYHLFKSREVASQEQCADAPVISKEYIDFFTDLLKVEDGTDPLLNLPLRSDEELRRLPKTAILVAGRDPLRDGGLILANKLAAMGACASTLRVHIFAGLPHGFRRFAELPSTAKFDRLLEECIRWGFENNVADTSQCAQ